MKTKDVLAYTLSVVVFFSYSRCMGPDSPPPRYPPGIKKSYIQNFIQTDTLVLLEYFRFKMEGNEIIEDDISLIRYQDSSRIFSIDDNIVIYGFSEWKEKFNGLTPEYYTQIGYDEIYGPLSGDTAYNREPIFGIANAPIAIIDTLESLTITTNTDYDAGHPAGSDVSGYFSVYFENPYLVVQNHYVQPEGGYRLSSVNYSIFPHIMTGGNLGEMSFTDKPFIGNTYICVLEHAPTVTGAYTFTVRLKKTTGEILEKTSMPIKIKGGGS